VLTCIVDPTIGIISGPTETAYTGDSWRCHRSTSPHYKDYFDESKPSKLVKTPRIEYLIETVRKQIHEDTTQPRSGSGPFILRISDSPLSEITSY